jgi:hypothetical protein
MCTIVVYKKSSKLWINKKKPIYFSVIKNISIKSKPFNI